MELFNKLGIDGSYVIIGLLFVMLLIIISYIILLNQHMKLKKSYNMFMEGADGESLESAIETRFKEVDYLKVEVNNIGNNVKSITEKLENTFQKISILKYDAFKEMGGKLSFSICMLNNYNDGFIITSMHSNREGCYTYIKEIIKGESFVMLSKEEKQVLMDAKENGFS